MSKLGTLYDLNKQVSVRQLPLNRAVNTKLPFLIILCSLWVSTVLSSRMLPSPPHSILYALYRGCPAGMRLLQGVRTVCRHKVNGSRQWPFSEFTQHEAQNFIVRWWQTSLGLYLKNKTNKQKQSHHEDLCLCFLVLELQLPGHYKVTRQHADGDRAGMRKAARFNDLTQLWIRRQIHRRCV